VAQELTALTLLAESAAEALESAPAKATEMIKDMRQDTDEPSHLCRVPSGEKFLTLSALLLCLILDIPGWST
jgi:hypothetical protein